MKLNLGFLDKIKSYAWQGTASVLAVLLLAQTYKVYDQNTDISNLRVDKSQLEVTLFEERKTAAEAVAQLQDEYRKKEQALSNQVTQINQDRNEQISSLAAMRDSLLKRVRNAEATAAAAKLSLSSVIAADGETPFSGDRAELLATIGTEDVEEATRAETIRLGLKACYRQYEDARQALGR